MNDLIQEVLKQLAEIVKPMVQNEMQLFQQQHKEIPQIHGHSVETTHGNASEAFNEATAYTRGHQGLHMGVQLIRRPSNVPISIGLRLGNATSWNNSNSNWEQPVYTSPITTVDSIG